VRARRGRASWRGARRPVASVLALASSALALGGCSGLTGSHAHRVAQWAVSSGVVANDQLVAADVRYVAVGISRRELVATHTACDGLASDAASAYGELPSPDTSLTSSLARAYLGYSRAAQDCSDAHSFASGAFARYDAAAAAAGRALGAARGRLAALGVR